MMKYKVRYEDFKNGGTKEQVFSAENDVHACLKIINSNIQKIDIVEDIDTYPIKIKKEASDIDVIRYPNNIVDAIDYIKRHHDRNCDFIYNIKNITTGKQVYPEPGLLLSGAIL